MKKMKKIVIALLAAGCFIFSVNAQVEGKHENTPRAGKENNCKPHRNHMRMQKMNITDAQKQEFKTIHSDYKARMEALEKNGSMTVKDYKVQKEILLKERKQKIQAVLTPQQKAQMESAMQKPMQKNNKVHLKLKELGLTKEQRAQLKTQKEATKTKMQSIKNDQSLTSEQKKEQIKVLRNTNMNDLKSVLTPEQLNKLEAEKTNK